MHYFIQKYKGLLQKTTCLLIGLFLLVGCHSKDNANSKLKTAIAQEASGDTQLFYEGTFAPIKIKNVVSPADGVVDKINFEYGQQVKQGHMLVMVNAEKLEDDFRDAVSAFLTAKNKLNSSLNNYKDNQALYKAGLISREEFDSAKNAMEGDRLSLLEEKYKLDAAIAEIPGLHVNIEELSIEDINKIKNVLAKQYKLISLEAPISGVAISPLNDDAQSNGNASGSSKIHVGSEIKKGQVLVAIGDLTGLSVKVLVNEIDIDRLKPGQAVGVTSPALPNIAFQGKIVSVASQAQTTDVGQSGLASFPVEVVIPKITEKQRALIKVGMSAKVKVRVSGKKSVVVPVDAVTEKNGQTVVTVIQPDGQQQTVPVQTGSTTPQGIRIIKGLQAGEKVVVHDQVS